MNKELLFEQIMDYVGTYCEKNEDFDYIMNNIEIMKDNFNEEEED